VRSRLWRSHIVTGSDDFFLAEVRDGTATDSIAPADQRLGDQLVPLLLEAIKSESSADIVSAATIALAKARRGCRAVGVHADVAIAPLLVHGNQEIAETAAVALGMLGRDTNVQLLELLLAGDTTTLRSKHGLDFQQRVPPRTRAFAAYGLGICGRDVGDFYQQLVLARALHTALQRELGQRGSDEVAAACVLSLGLLSLPTSASDVAVEPEQPDLLTSREGELRYLLSLFQNPRTASIVLAQVPLSIARVAATLPPAAPIRIACAKRLLGLVTSRATREDIRRSAVLGAAQLAGTSEELDAATYTALADVVRNDADVQARCFALVSLGEASGLGSIPGNRDLAQAVLLETLSKGQLETRSWAALGLGLQQRLRRDANAPTSDSVAGILRSALAESHSPSTTGALAIAIGLADDRGAIDVVHAKLTGESDPKAKGHLCVALGMLDARKCGELIATIAVGARYQTELLTNAATGLGLLCDSSGINTLIDLLQTSNSLATQAGLATALGRLGDARALDPLFGIVRDHARPELLRAFALVALGGIADDRELPWNERLARDINYRAAPPTLTSPADARGVLDIL
jgi:HEAT repeat protein